MIAAWLLFTLTALDPAHPATATRSQDRPPLDVEGKVPFLRSYDEAFRVAKSTGKPVLAYFTFDG